MRSYYQIPLKADVMLNKQRHPLCKLEDSIRHHIHLVLKTHYDEYRFDPYYGCYIWDKDYENIQSVSKWMDELEDLIIKALNVHEIRLSQINVNVEVDEPDMVDPKTNKITRPHKRITIRINGIIKATNQPFVHTEIMFFSPLSLA